MRKILRNTLLVLSFSVAVASVVLWIRNIRYMDGVRFGRGSDFHLIYARDGSVHYMYVGDNPIMGTPGWTLISSPQAVRFAVISDRPKWHFLGFGFGDASNPTTTIWWVSFPLWLVLLLFFCLPLMWLIQIRRSRARQQAQGFEVVQRHGTCWLLCPSWQLPAVPVSILNK